MKLPLSYLDELTPMEIGWLIENHFEEKMEYFELMSSAVTFGYVNAKKKGKKLNMFKKKQENESKKITLEDRNRDVEYFENLFAKGESD